MAFEHVGEQPGQEDYGSSSQAARQGLSWAAGSVPGGRPTSFLILYSELPPYTWGVSSPDEDLNFWRLEWLGDRRASKA